MQVIIGDSVNMTRMSLPAFTLIRIQSVNDEPPLIRNTSSMIQFIEERGPVRIIDEGVAIVDSDNCPNHTTVMQLLVSLVNPVPQEDLLIIRGEVYENYTVAFSCDTEVDGSQCYEDFLRSIEYNNTNKEPDSYSQSRIISIQV